MLHSAQVVISWYKILRNKIKMFGSNGWPTVFSQARIFLTVLTTQIHFICTDFNKLHFFVESETKMCMVQPIICAVVYFSPCQSFLMDRVNWSSYILELWKVTSAVVDYSLCLRVKSYQTPGVWAVYITPGTYCAQWIEYRLSVHHSRNN